MSTDFKLNAIISLPDTFDENLKVGDVYTIIKSGTRVMPIGKPMELCTSKYIYLAKVSVLKLVLEADKTEITFRVVKVFTEVESKVFSENFIRSEEV